MIPQVGLLLRKIFEKLEKRRVRDSNPQAVSGPQFSKLLRHQLREHGRAPPPGLEPGRCLRDYSTLSKRVPCQLGLQRYSAGGGIRTHMPCFRLRIFRRCPLLTICIRQQIATQKGVEPLYHLRGCRFSKPLLYPLSHCVIFL